MKTVKDDLLICEVLDSLVDMPLFDSLTPAELRVISKYMSICSYSPKELLFSEGDVGDFVGFVVEGEFNVVKEMGAGKSLVLAKLPRGRIIGEMALLDEHPRSASIRARDAAKLVRLERENFEKILEEYPKTGVKLLKSFARLLSLKLRRTSGHLVTTHAAQGKLSSELNATLS